MIAGLAAAGRRAAAAAVRRAGDAVVAAAAAELPGVAVDRAGDDVVLRGPGLRARALGSRRRDPDARVTGLVDAVVLGAREGRR